MKSFEEIYDEAHKAAYEAASNFRPTPMIVSMHENMLDDNSPIQKQWYVSDGVCGFAWVHIKPANCKFAKWLLANDYAHKDSYYGGINIYVGYFNQSMQRKEIYAAKFIEVVQQYLPDLKIYSQSRMD